MPLWVCLLLFCLNWVGTVAAQSASGAAGVQIVAFGDLRGDLLPCGCSPEGQLGGLPRRETYWNDLLKRTPAGGAPPLLLDLGNNFPEPSAQGRLKLDVIQGFLARMPVAAILPGPNELQNGYAALDVRLPYTVTNNGLAGAFAASQSVERDGKRILVLGYLSPSLVYQGSQDRFRLLPLDPPLMDRYAAFARQAPGRTVLLFRGDDRELDAFVRSGLFAAIVAGNPSGDELTAATERRVGGAAIPQVPTKGQGAVVLTLGGVADSSRQALGGVADSSRQALGGVADSSRQALGNAASARVDKLTESIPDGPEALAALKVYDGRVKGLFFEQMAERESRAKDSPFVGAVACQACHAAEFAVWQSSLHTHSLQGLEKVGKQFDPECLACHVVGVSQGGFVSADITPQLAGVQCESCHGPGRAHLAHPAKVKMTAVGAGTPQPGEATCRTCHRGAHSPKFAFPAYWPRIVHGAPTAQR